MKFAIGESGRLGDEGPQISWQGERALLTGPCTVDGKQWREGPLRDGMVISDQGQRWLVRRHEAGLRLDALDQRGLALWLRGVGLRIGDRLIIDGIDADFSEGSLSAIIGPSGSGKSSLLRCLFGIQEISTGSITYSGASGEVHALDAASVEAYRADIGIVTQGDHLIDAMSVRSALLVAADLALVPTDERVDRMETALAAVELTPHADTLVGVCSGGQRRRLSIARALIARPRLLILDEPTSGLDLAVAHEVMGLLRRLANQGITVLCSSHLPATLSPCDQVLLMDVHGGCGRVLARLDRSALLAALARDGDGSHLGGHNSQPMGALPPAPAISAEAGEPAQPFLHTRQVGAVLRRSVASFGADGTARALLILQPILLALMVVLTQGDHQHAHRYLDFFAVIAALWTGMSLSARELVGERTLTACEALGGCATASWLTAKILWSLILATLAALILTVAYHGGLWLLLGADPLIAAATLGKGRDAAAVALLFVERSAVLVLTASAGALLGLVISALARSERVAVAAMPILILPQVLFSRVATGGADQPAGADGPFRDLLSGGPWHGSLEGLQAWIQALIGLPMSSRHAAWVLDHLANRQPWRSDALGLALVLALHLLILVVVVTLMRRRWLEALR